MAVWTRENEQFEAVNLVVPSVCLPVAFSALSPDLCHCELKTEPFFQVFSLSSKDDGLDKAF